MLECQGQLVDSGGYASTIDAMKIEYDPKADAMYIRLLAGIVAESNEVHPGVVLDFDADGRMLGIEVLDVSKRTDNPHELAMGFVTDAPNVR